MRVILKSGQAAQIRWRVTTSPRAVRNESAVGARQCTVFDTVFRPAKRGRIRQAARTISFARERRSGRGERLSSVSACDGPGADRTARASWRISAVFAAAGGCRIVRHEEGRGCRKTLKVDFHLWPSRLASADDTISAGSISAGSSSSPGGLATCPAGATDPIRVTRTPGRLVGYWMSRPPVTPVLSSIFPGSRGSPTGAVPPGSGAGRGGRSSTLAAARRWLPCHTLPARR